MAPLRAQPSDPAGPPAATQDDAAASGAKPAEVATEPRAAPPETADAVTADEVAADEVAADEVAADEVAADEVAADEVAADEVRAALAADAAARAPAAGAVAPSGPVEPARPTPPADSPPAALGGGAFSLNPDITLILDVAFAHFSEEENLQTGGHDPTATGFNLQQFEMSVGAAVDPYLRLDGSLVFSQFGVELEEAYGTTLGLPARLQARFGQFLHRFGRINATHLHAWDFVDQPFAVGRIFGAEGGRGLGVELSWLSPLPWYAELVGTALQADGEGTARSFYADETFEIDDPADLLYVTALEQFFPLSDDWSCSWGLSAALGPNATGRDNRTDVYGTDLYLKYRPITRESQQAITWQTEVFYRRRQIPDQLLQDVSLYSQLVVQLTKRWAVAGRYEFGSPAVGLDGEVGLDALDPEWVDERQRVALNASFWPSEFSRFRLQGSYDAPGWLERGIWATFLTAELVVGPHGAHTF
ncbi:MAG TPA: hypothetical protein VI197_32765 [Polyangiaceae bacterium]